MLCHYVCSEGMLTDAKSSWIRESVSVLECSVLQWTEQVREVLNRKLEGSSHQHPEPAHHYKFWRRRGKSLRFIRDQVSFHYSTGKIWPNSFIICYVLRCLAGISVIHKSGTFIHKLFFKNGI